MRLMLGSSRVCIPVTVAETVAASTVVRRAELTIFEIGYMGNIVLIMLKLLKLLRILKLEVGSC